jgi:hypothetical protein
MIRLGTRIRLTKREVERFPKITGIEPGNVKSLDALAACIARCHRLYAGEHRDARFLRSIIDRERSRCLGQCALTAFFRCLDNGDRSPAGNGTSPWGLLGTTMLLDWAHKSKDSLHDASIRRQIALHPDGNRAIPRDGH